MDVNDLKAQLIRDEGLRLKPYLDTAGKWTIGVGRNLSDDGLTPTEVDILLLADIQRVQRELNVAIPWWLSMDNKRQLVFANMVFNMGLPRFLGFKRMLAAAKVGDYATAAKEMLDSEWSKQVGDRAERLAKMMEEG